MHGLLGSSITDRIATGPREGQKVFTLQTLPPEPDTPRSPRARAFRYTLKTPYRDGTTHVIFEPEDFIARLAALVPKPRAHLTRYHGVKARYAFSMSRVMSPARSSERPIRVAMRCTSCRSSPALGAGSGTNTRRPSPERRYTPSSTSR